MTMNVAKEDSSTQVHSRSTFVEAAETVTFRLKRATEGKKRRRGKGRGRKEKE